MYMIKRLLVTVILLLAFPLVVFADGEVKEEELHLDKHLLHRATELARVFEGISFGLGLTGVLQGTVNNDDVSPSVGDITDFAGSFDLELQREFNGGSSIFILVEAGAGEGLMDEFPFDSLLLGGVNDDAGSSDSRLEITEAWYEVSLLEGRAVLTAGKVDLSNYFDNNGVANDETAQFLATTLVNSSAIEFPDNGPGMRLTFNLSDNVAFSLGSMEGDADFEDVFDDLFVMGELDISADFLSAAGGNYRFFAWLNATDHVSLKNPALMREKGYGYGISFDQGVTDDLTLFARAGWQTDEVYPLEVVWSAGFELKTGLPGRENDAFGVAYAHGIANSAVVGLEDEGRLELYYSVFINERISLTPDVQVVFNPTGSKALDDVVVLGLRVQVVF